ncbi:site-specific DNA-methyltransferase (adenine-specific) [Cohaesibacter sp. ES.047]|uniref:DNA-methyltransferase n=1 Tax=Cohaesibacter sp. ES.047 TaxID=1798205 RepID=UPI000BB873AD|nr:site-specific DNA-methyltransferase [Cohaesibacter sp. ES.047]SNY94090.1 site-specific DNA-methyltransferase (adenine-specific) [Cohaesibacter sp. ES.047]
MTLHLADARDITVRDADLIVSDVPYKLTQGGRSPHPDAPRGGWLKEYDNKGQPVVCDISWDEIMDLCFQSLAPRAHAYVFCNDKNLCDALNAASRAGFRFHNLLIWNKRSAMPNRWYMKPAEFVLFLGKGKAFTINQPGSMALVEMPWPDETNHPTEKPWPLLQRYIRNSCEEGAVVFDPFMGSGSTGVAAAKLGRQFIGIEIEQKWFDVAEARIAKAQREFQTLGGQASFIGASKAADEQLYLEGLQDS